MANVCKIVKMNVQRTVLHCYKFSNYFCKILSSVCSESLLELFNIFGIRSFTLLKELNEMIDTTLSLA